MVRLPFGVRGAKAAAAAGIKVDKGLGPLPPIPAVTGRAKALADALRQIEAKFGKNVRPVMRGSCRV